MLTLLKRAASPLGRSKALCLSFIILLCLHLAAQTQSESGTRQKLLQYLESGQLQDAVLLGQQAVSRWPKDPQLRHYLGVAYFKTGDLKPEEGTQDHRQEIA